MRAAFLGRLGRIGIGIGFLWVGATAHAGVVLPEYRSDRSVRSPMIFETILAGGAEDYQIGSEWGKKPVLKADLAERSPAFRRAALATARVGGGTGFYLGKFGGFHWVATNHHVCPSAWRCVGGKASFALLEKSYSVKQLVGHWTEIDLALLIIDVPSSDESMMAEVGRPFFWGESLDAGDPLLTIGYGVAGNPRRQLMANEDADCKVFSQRGEYRWMGDPDQYNPGEYKAWSFSNGCDVSHGDSGSAMIDRESGQVVGIIWTGRIPKAKSIQNSGYLDQIFRQRSEEIWQELSYAVPASKIHEVLTEVVQKPTFDRRFAQAMEELLRAR